MANKLSRISGVLKDISFTKQALMLNTAMFFSFNGQYNDNPRYISEALHEAAPDIEIVWALNDETVGLQPDYVRAVPCGSDEAKRIAACARVYVDNYTGRASFRMNKVLPDLYRRIKRADQINLSTWHGTPIKHIHGDIIGKQSVPEGCFSTCDVFMAGNTFTGKKMCEGLGGKLHVEYWGTPRNDVLVNATPQSVAEAKARVGFSPDERIVLYAPTFRDDVYASGITQMEMLDVQALLEAFQSRFGGVWRFALRVHPGVYAKLTGERAQLFAESELIDANTSQEMADYLLACDALITDYSGSMADFCLTHKPAFLFANDLAHYAGVERGMYFEPDELPYEFTQTPEDLLAAVTNYDTDTARAKSDAFLARIGNCEDGQAAKRAVAYLLETAFGRSGADAAHSFKTAQV